MSLHGSVAASWPCPIFMLSIIYLSLLLFFLCNFCRLDHQSDDEDVLSFPGKRRLISFLSWLDYVDQLSKEAHKVITVSVTQWHVTVIP